MSLDKPSNPRLFPLSSRANSRKTLKDLKLEFKKAGEKILGFTIFLTPDKEEGIRIAIQQDEEQ